jgi:YgiT-type zinc finger domain-containing protein
MKCAICKQGDLLAKYTEVVFHKNGQTILIKDVPALICNSCGEEYFDDDTSQRLLCLTEQTDPIIPQEIVIEQYQAVA